MAVKAKILPSLEELRETFELVAGGSGLRWKPDCGVKKTAGKMAGMVWTNPRTGKRYWDVKLAGKHWLVHRIVYALSNGVLPDPEMDIDHINGDGLNNLPSNLRLATRRQNMENRKGATRSSKSGILGVCWNEQKSKYQAHIRTNGKQIHLGLFTSLVHAVEARIMGEFDYFGRPITKLANLPWDLMLELIDYMNRAPYAEAVARVMGIEVPQ